MEGNLTKGPILKTLTKLAVPIMASSFLGTLYNITDMAWIGLLGSKAVAGVGVGGMFTWFSQGLASMSRMGGQVQVAQCIGRGDREEAHKYAQTAVQLATLMGLLFAAVMFLSCTRCHNNDRCIHDIIIIACCDLHWSGKWESMGNI